MNGTQATEVAVDSAVSSEPTSEMIQDADIPGPLETEEVRPMKKAKSEDQENSKPGDVGGVNDG